MAVKLGTMSAAFLTAILINVGGARAADSDNIDVPVQFALLMDAKDPIVGDVTCHLNDYVCTLVADKDPEIDVSMTFYTDANASSHDEDIITISCRHLPCSFRNGLQAARLAEGHRSGRDYEFDLVIDYGDGANSLVLRQGTPVGRVLLIR
jgi:hypothetical protein